MKEDASDRGAFFQLVETRPTEIYHPDHPLHHLILDEYEEHFEELRLQAELDDAQYRSTLSC